MDAYFFHVIKQNVIDESLFEPNTNYEILN